MRTRLLAGAIGLLFLLAAASLFVVRDHLAPVAAAPPRPGTYRYRSVGAGTRTSPSTTTDRLDRTYSLRYEPLPDSAPGETLLRRRSETSGFQDKAWRADGIYDVTETYTGQSGTRTCSWQPRRLVVALPLLNGESWKNDARCDWSAGDSSVRLHLTESGRVTGRKHVTIGGKGVDVFVIETNATWIETREQGAGAPATFARKEKATSFFAPSVGVVVHAEQKQHILNRIPGNKDFEMWVETRDDLLSLTPT